MKNSSDSSNSSSSSNQPNFANPYELAKTILANTGNDTPAPIFASLDLYGNAVNVNALHSTDQNDSASTTPTSCKTKAALAISHYIMSFRALIWYTTTCTWHTATKISSPPQA